MFALKKKIVFRELLNESQGKSDNKMGVPATVWDVAGTGFGTWACGSGLDVSLGLTFHPHQLFQHLVGGADDLRGSRVGPLHHDHVGEFLTDIDC